MASIVPRQESSVISGPIAETTSCAVFRLPPNGILIFNHTATSTLAQPAFFEPACMSQSTLTAEISSLPIIDYKDPFYESTIPQVFVLGAMLIIAWSLVIILVITPRTQLIVGGHGGSSLGRNGVLGATANSATVIGVGGRPWLQKVAALTVALSLLIATVTTFKVVEDQYWAGYDDAATVTDKVVGSLEIRIIRLISDTFLWLAQAQTVIRLFPRHKEKVITKWAGFGLITLDTLFSILNTFVPNVTDETVDTRNNKKFNSAIPALSYLFGTLLSLTYAACVLYYSWVKSRFAYFHPKMRNICVVALLSIVSILVPVAFFVLDIANPYLVGWGDYVRWVGAAAASVVVWEWVERIEALEREERKEGILGREVFDGDEMAQVVPSIDVQWPRSRSNYKRPGGGSGGTTVSRGTGSTTLPTGTTTPAHPPRYSRHANSGEASATAIASDTTRSWPPSASNATSPVSIASPIPRSNTNSATSTVYAVVRPSVSTSPPPGHESPLPPIVLSIPATPSNPNSSPAANITSLTNDNQSTSQTPSTRPPTAGLSSNHTYLSHLPALSNPFKRRRHDPPPQVSQSAVDPEGRPSSVRTSRGLIGARNLLRPRRHQPVPLDQLPVVVVPAQPRDKVWTPPVADSGERAATAAVENSPERNSDAAPASESPAAPTPNMGAEAVEGSGKSSSGSLSVTAGPSLSPPLTTTASLGSPIDQQPGTPTPVPLDTRSSLVTFHVRSSGSVLSTLPVVQEQGGSEGSRDGGGGIGGDASGNGRHNGGGRGGGR